MAFKELDMASRGIPLVVRLRGTNDEIGQNLVGLTCVYPVDIR